MDGPNIFIKLSAFLACTNSDFSSGLIFFFLNPVVFVYTSYDGFPVTFLTRH